MPAPGATHYVAPSKYTQMAYVLGFGGHGEAERRERLFARVEELLDDVDMPRSLAEAGHRARRLRRGAPRPRARRLRRPQRAHEPAHPARLGAARAARGRLRRPMSVDLHCHILPALDDGAVDLEDSLAHGPAGRGRRNRDDLRDTSRAPDHSVGPHAIAGHVADLQGALDSAGIGVHIAPGAEIAETVAPDLDVAELRAASLGGAGGWILLEPAPGPLSDSLVDVVDTLAPRGLRSLIAHPERHLVANRAARGARAGSTSRLPSRRSVT